MPLRVAVPANGYSYKVLKDVPSGTVFWKRLDSRFQTKMIVRLQVICKTYQILDSRWFLRDPESSNLKLVKGPTWLVFKQSWNLKKYTKY